MENILKIESIEKYYGNKSSLTKAINNISFQVEKGEFVAIMGASGSGKTTLLNCISTIDKVTSGNIYVAGRNITNLNGKELNKFRREELGFIFQDFNLLDTLTAYENIALALSIQGVKPDEIDARIREVARELDIESVLKKYPYEMSGGQKQRVASARAIKAYRNMGFKGMIGLVSDSYPIEILKDNEGYREAKRLADIFFNTSVNDTCIKGYYPDEYVSHLTKLGYDLSYMLEEDKEVFQEGTVDYLGVNAYCRFLVKPCSGGETKMEANNTGDSSKNEEMEIKDWCALDDDPNTEKTPWGTEIYPKSVYDMLMEFKELYPDTPIIVTENGLGEYDKVENGEIHDQYRIDFLQGYVDWIKKAIDNGCDCRGYFVWSTMDVYSWINGYKKRYGLVYIDFDDNCKRIPKDSYHWYKKFINEKGGSYNGKN